MADRRPVDDRLCRRAPPAPGAAACSRSCSGRSCVITVSIIFDPNDIFFPVTFFWFVPWLAGRTLRNQTMLARELAEKAERAEHARAEDERRAIAIERSRIARELHDVLAHNLSVMVVQASAGAPHRRARTREQAVEVAALIERTGREALAEIRHLFGAVRRGEGEDLSGPPSIARVDELARRARAAGLQGRAARPRATRRASAGHRPDRLPDRPGGAHQRAQARRQRAGVGDGRLRAERARAEHRGRRRGPARGLRAQRGRGRPRPRRHARARGALRRARAGGPAARRRLRRARAAPHAPARAGCRALGRAGKVPA